MKKDNIINFKRKNGTNLKEKYELQDYDDELLEFVGKLVACNPSAMSRKAMEESKKQTLENMRVMKEFRNGGALSDDELDAVAGGVSAPELAISSKDVVNSVFDVKKMESLSCVDSVLGK